MPIARLRGVIEATGDDWTIVGVAGVGVLASVPARLAEGLARGAPVTLFTHLHVREDALVLYGFASGDDLALFEQLISVSGVGPRVALALLSELDYADLTTAIASGHVDVLRKVSGVGQKTAERLVLELRDKVVPPAEAVPRAREAERHVDAETVAALMGLGYSQAEAAAAAGRLPDDGDLPIEERVRRALAYFARA